MGYNYQSVCSSDFDDTHVCLMIFIKILKSEGFSNLYNFFKLYSEFNVLTFAAVKKMIVFILFMVYGLSSFGVSLNYFYCCDKLEDVSVTLNKVHEKDCTMKMEDNKNCCDNKTVALKLSPDQKANFHQDYNFQPLFTIAELPVMPFESISYSKVKEHPQFHNLPPPFLEDRTVLYANFRI